MSRKQKHVFDLDNTLIYTDELNNASYNTALNQVGLKSIDQCQRITREVVLKFYPDIAQKLMKEVIILKQIHFINNINSTTPNSELLGILKMQEKESCILWTSASEERTHAIIEFYDIKEKFIEILFSKKDNISNDIIAISEKFKCLVSDLVFYEDDLEIMLCLNEFNLRVMVSK